MTTSVEGPPLARERFRAMGTGVELIVEGSGAGVPAAIAAARAEIERLERMLSRFRHDSRLSRLNRMRRASVGRETAVLVARALALRDLTGGRFDPAVGAAVRAAGYDRTFEALLPDGPGADPVPGGGGIDVDVARGVVALGEGVLLDLGGIAKGYAADRAAAILAEAGPALANMGGDVAVAGPARAGGWPVGLETAGGTVSIALPGGGLATSGVDRRRWRRGGGEAHHVIDPRTGAPAATDLVRATAIAGSAADAEAIATALLVAGRAAAPRLAADLAIPALLVPVEGDHLMAGGLE